MFLDVGILVVVMPVPRYLLFGILFCIGQQLFSRPFFDF